MDDLVAELTLRLRNEMNAGLEEIKGEFAGLDGTLQSLRDVLGGLTAELAAMRGPLLVTDDLAGVVTAANEAVTAVDAIGTALKADADEAKALKDAMAGIPGAGPYGFQNTFAPPQAGDEGDPNRPAFVPPGTVLPGPEQPAPEEDQSGRKKSGGGDIGGDFLMDVVVGVSGYDDGKDYADYQSVLGQAVTTEKLHGAAYDAELSRLQDMMDVLALKYNSNSLDLAKAYKYLITTGLPASEIDALMPSLAEASTAHAIDVTDMQGAVFALADSFKISPDQMGAVLAQLGYATKMGHFSAESFGQYLPVIGGALATAGDTGPDVADHTYAALETIIKNVSIPSEAANDYREMINYVGTQHAERSFLQMSRMMLPQMREMFAKYGVQPADLYGMEDQAVAEGKDPIETILDFVHNATAKMSPTDRNAVISDWFTNLQGGDAVRSLMLHWNDSVGPDGQVIPGYQSDYTQLKQIGQGTLDDDFQNSLRTEAAPMNTFEENFRQDVRILGDAFDHIASIANFVQNPGYGPVTSPTFWNTDNPTNPHMPHFGRLDVHINVAPDGTPTSTVTTAPAGVNLLVNQGQVLNTP